MANIQHWLDQIRRAVYGREVRSSIADAIEAINKEQSYLDGAFDQLIINAGNSNAEVVAARVKADGTPFNTLGERLNKNDADLLNLSNNIYDQLDYIIYLDENDNGNINSQTIQEKLDRNTNVLIKSKNNSEYKIKNTIEIDNNFSVILDNNTILKNDSLSNMIRKKGNIDRLQNVKLIGGIYNYDNQPTGNNNLHTIFIHKCDDLLIEKLQVLNSSKYAFLLADINRATIKDITLNTPSDGIHFQPPLRNILVENIKGTTHDDMIAITIGDYDAYNTSAGDVEDVVIRNIQPNNSMRALKLCGQNGYKFKNVLMEQVYGTTFYEGFYLRTDGNILNDFTADRIHLKDINVKTGGDDYPLFKLWTSTQMNIDTLILENIKHDGYLFDIRGTGTWTVNIKNLYLKNIDLSNSSAENILKYFGFIGVNVTIENLILENVKIDNISSNVFECFIENRGTIKNLFINGARLYLQGNNGAFIRNISGIINNIFIDNYYQHEGANFYYQINSEYDSVINLSNSFFDDVFLAFNIKCNATFNMSNISTSRNGSTFNFSNVDGIYKLFGEFTNTHNLNTNCLAASCVGTIHVNGDIPVDVEKVTGEKGYKCRNTNAGILTGLGIYLYDVFDWVLATGLKYYLYKNTHFTVGKYESVYRCNGNLTITLPDPTNIKGKEYIFIPMAPSSLTINNHDGANVGTVTTTTRALSIGTGWLLY